MLSEAFWEDMQSKDRRRKAKWSGFINDLNSYASAKGSIKDSSQ